MSPATTALSSVCALLGLIFCYELLWPVHVTEPRLKQVTTIQRGFIIPPVVFPPQSEISALTERPLFTPARKPVPKPASPAAGLAAPSLPQVWLVGVILAGDNKLAIIRTSDGNLAQSYKVGDQLGGWLVKTILSDHIILAAGSFEHVLEISAPKPHEAVAAPPAEATP